MYDQLVMCDLLVLCRCASVLNRYRERINKQKVNCKFQSTDPLPQMSTSESQWKQLDTWPGYFSQTVLYCEFGQWLIFSHTKGKQLYRMLIMSFCYPNKQNGNSLNQACASPRGTVFRLFEQIGWMNDSKARSVTFVPESVCCWRNRLNDDWLKEESCLSPPNGVTSCKIERVNTDKQTILRYKL